MDRFSVRVTGDRAVTQALRDVGNDADNALRAACDALVSVLAGRIAADARGSDRQSAAVAGTVRAQPGADPAIVIGGSAPVTSGGVPAYKILFGAMFGARSLVQFRAHLGDGSYWGYATIGRSDALFVVQLDRAADRLERDFDRGA